MTLSNDNNNNVEEGGRKFENRHDGPLIFWKASYGNRGLRVTKTSTNQTTKSNKVQIGGVGVIIIKI